MLYSERSGWENHRFERSADTQVLEDGVTYVWWIDLQVMPEMVDRVMQLLSPTERSRAGRIADNAVHREFVMTRSVLRLLLASYTGCAPEGLQLINGSYGKLAVDGAGVGIEFKVTHSNGLALICLSCDRRVGVDLEYIRRMAELDRMGMLTLTAGERAAVSGESEPLEAFFRCWVRKEAVVKAAGVGLSASLSDLEVITSRGPAGSAAGRSP